jgi:DNA-binding CsgD family transcriptional regulator
VLLGDRVLLEYEVGDFGQGEAYLERFLATMPPAAARPGSQYASPAVTIPWIARITGVLDRLDIAETAAQTVVSSPFANPVFAMMARTGLGLLAVLRDDAAAAAEQYGPLQSHRGTMSWATSIDHLLGLLAHTMGQLDKAAEHFEDGLAFCRKAGYRPGLAWTCCDYAEALLDPGLTHREVEVLRLVAAGKTDREIAEQLIISVRTVTTHVSNILNKTGAVNRTEAATYANRQGLV